MDFQPDVFLEALTSETLLQGAVVTVALTIVSFAGGLLLGLIVALMHESPLRLVRGIAWTYVWIFRAIPALILLFIVWFALPQLFPVFREAWFVPFLAAAFALAINEAAYAAEILRGGLMAVDDGQRLAARSLGMRPGQVFRKVIAPQLTRVTIPPMSNEFVAMLKTTSLASVVSVRELMTTAQTAVSSTFRFAEWYGAAAVYYLILVSIFMVGQVWLERRYRWTSQGRGQRSILRAIGR